MVKAIVGANWGDEGKGKITDMLAESSDVVIRFQGGANAGHTIINDRGRFALHTLPSGAFYPHVTNIIGNGVALDCENLWNEMQDVMSQGVPITPENLKISDRASLLLPWHRELDGLDAIRLSGTEAQGWYVEEARAAMEAGEILYAGKYSAPDYERIYAEGCDLAVESTMIYHTPEVKEQLEELGVPVLVERSSYEGHPLGRMEWLKLYGVLLGKEDQAQERFQQTLDRLAPVLDQEGTGKTVAFFYITSNGGVNVRKPGDYISKLIGMAGGEYVFQDLGGEENALSTMNLQMEAFYAGAKDADLLIYNSAVDGGLRTLDELLEKNEVLAEFRAVQEGNVWCTGQDLFQSSMGLGDLLLDIHTVLTQEDPEPESLTYLYRLTKEG